MEKARERRKAEEKKKELEERLEQMDRKMKQLFYVDLLAIRLPVAVCTIL